MEKDKLRKPREIYQGVHQQTIMQANPQMQHMYMPNGQQMPQIRAAYPGAPQTRMQYPNTFVIQNQDKISTYPAVNYNGPSYNYQHQQHQQNVYPQQSYAPRPAVYAIQKSTIINKNQEKKNKNKDPELLQYDRDFLLSFQCKPICLLKPGGLPDIDIVLDSPHPPTKPLNPSDRNDFVPILMRKSTKAKGVKSSAILPKDGQSPPAIEKCVQLPGKPKELFSVDKNEFSKAMADTTLHDKIEQINYSTSIEGLEVNKEQQNVNKEKKVQYSRDFLLNFQSQPICLLKPLELPDIDIVLDSPHPPTEPLNPSERKEFMLPAFIRKKIASEQAAKKSLAKVEEKLEEFGQKEEFQRKVASVLENLTQQNLLEDQITALGINNVERLGLSVDLIFEKAVRKPKCSAVYANTCRVLLEYFRDSQGDTVQGHKDVFRTLLENKFKKQFEKEKDEKQETIFESENNENKICYDEVERIGNVKFAAELFKMKMISVGILHECVLKLLQDAKEESLENNLEYFCQLLTPVGKDLEPWVDQYFEKIYSIIEEGKVNSRILFALKNVIELRNGGWTAKVEQQFSEIKSIKGTENIHEKCKEQIISFEGTAHQSTQQESEKSKCFIDTKLPSKTIEIHQLEEASLKSKKTLNENEGNKLFHENVKSILKKLTPQNFDTLANELTSLSRMRDVDNLTVAVNLIFEKGISQPELSIVCAEMCYLLSRNLTTLADADNTNQPSTLHKILQRKCEAEFENEKWGRNRMQKECKNQFEFEQEKKLILPKLHQKELHEKNGNIKFIGQLFKLKMIPEKIILDFINKLLKNAKRGLLEQQLESLCEVLISVGKDLDTTESKPRMDQYFQKISSIIAKEDISSRMLFAMTDLIELRNGGWKSQKQLKEGSRPGIYTNTSKSEDKLDVSCSKSFTVLDKNETTNTASVDVNNNSQVEKNDLLKLVPSRGQLSEMTSYKTDNCSTTSGTRPKTIDKTEKQTDRDADTNAGIRKQGIQSTEILKNVPSDEKVSVDAHSLLLNSLFFTENKSLEVDLQKNFKRSTAQSVEIEYENEKTITRLAAKSLSRDLIKADQNMCLVCDKEAMDNRQRLFLDMTKGLKQLEIEVLYAVQEVVASMFHPRGLLASLFHEFHSRGIISKEVFFLWEKSDESIVGKPIALLEANEFLLILKTPVAISRE